jgi:hypothetical protein
MKTSDPRLMAQALRQKTAGDTRRLPYNDEDDGLRDLQDAPPTPNNVASVDPRLMADALRQAAPPAALGPDQAMDNDPLEAQFLEMAKKLGIDPSQPPESVMRQMWEKMPTDAVGEMIDEMSNRSGVPPPWAQQRR